MINAMRFFTLIAGVAPQLAGSVSSKMEARPHG